MCLMCVLGPMSPPRNLTIYNHTAVSVWLSWEPPLEPNGVVIQYGFRILDLITHTVTHQVPLISHTESHSTMTTTTHTYNYTLTRRKYTPSKLTVVLISHSKYHLAVTLDSAGTCTYSICVSIQTLLFTPLIWIGWCNRVIFLCIYWYLEFIWFINNRVSIRLQAS